MGVLVWRKSAFKSACVETGGPGQVMSLGLVLAYEWPAIHPLRAKVSTRNSSFEPLPGLFSSKSCGLLSVEMKLDLRSVAGLDVFDLQHFNLPLAVHLLEILGVEFLEQLAALIVSFGVHYGRRAKVAH